MANGDHRRVGSRAGNVTFRPSKRARACAVLFAVALVAAPAAARPAGPAERWARWTWPKGAHVVVRIADDFSTGGARLAIETAFRKWEAACGPEGNGSDVSFAFAGGASTPPAYTYRDAYGRVRAGGQAHTVMLSAPSGVFVAWTVIDPRVTDPVAISHVMAHEIGHTFGLAECDACGAGLSVMTRFSGDFNDTVSGRNAPSDEDNAAVRANGGY